MALQLGLYKIKEVVRFQNTSKFPVALVSYKRDVSQTAVENLFFYVELKQLYNVHSKGNPTNLRPDQLKGKLIHVLDVFSFPELTSASVLKISESIEWELVDMFKLYDLYKQQGDGLLVVPPSDWDEYDEIEGWNYDDENDCL